MSKYNILFLKSRMVTIEFQNNEPYYTKCFNVYLNGDFIKEENRNVFSISNLTPDTDYTLNLDEDCLNFKTPSEFSVYVDDFGCIHDGICDDTIKIQSAILSAPPGSTVIFTSTYLVTSLYLKSGVDLYFFKGSKLIANTNRNDYPIHQGYTNVGIWEGSHVNNFASTLNLIDIENVSIYGDGEIDGKAEEGDWYINHRVMTIAWRGHSIFMKNARNINVVGLYIHNSQAWSIHPFDSNNILFYNLTISNNKNMPTTDGIDPDMCNSVYIKGCKFNVGDDCIAIKSGTFELAKKYKKPCQNIFIENNLMEDGHGGVVFGSESSGGIKNVIVKKCIFSHTDRGLRIKTRRGRGNIGSIDNINFSNIIMDFVKTPFVINSYYNMGPKGGHEEYVWSTKPQPVTELTPILGKFLFEDMLCTSVSIAAGVFLGLPEMMIEEVSLKNIKFTYNKDAIEESPCMIEHPFKLKNAGIYAMNVKEIILDNIEFIDVIGDKVKKIYSN